jgi:uncharacterized protein YdeI (BOF family)
MFMIARTFVYKPKISTFGQPISESMVTAIPNILAHPEQFQGKIVRIEGVITEECPAGGWFILKDQSGIIYVNLHPSEFAIPQVVGRHVVTQGLVRKEGTQVEIIGKGVQIK